MVSPAGELLLHWAQQPPPDLEDALARQPSHLTLVPAAAPNGRGLLWVLPLGAASLGLHWLVLGARLGGDSQRYLEAGARLLAGQPLVDKQADFLAYDWLVAGVGWLGGGPAGVVLAQCLLALLAGVLLYLGGRQALGHSAGLALGLAFLCWPDLQRWNFYVLTDGPFNSLLAAGLGLGLLTARRPLWWLGLLPCLALLAVMRPEGPLFLLPLALYLGLRGQPASALFILALALLAWLVHPPSPASRAELVDNWLRATVIWGYSQLEGGLGLEPAPGQGPAHLAWRALLANPWVVLGLLARRGFWFLAHVRPFYSPAHNLLAGLGSLGLLLLGVWGALASGGHPRERVLGWAVLGLQLALALFTWADWDGRFLTRVTPALMLLAAEALLGEEAPPSLNQRGQDSFSHL